MSEITSIPLKSFELKPLDRWREVSHRRLSMIHNSFLINHDLEEFAALLVAVRAEANYRKESTFASELSKEDQWQTTIRLEYSHRDGLTVTVIGRNVGWESKSVYHEPKIWPL